ncbi:MAG: hypothetical protein NZ828_10230 [Alphaproteobacteria bacterium]|nr:hypothetical protein [Alphaproteobacteria bacterium]
MIGYITLGANDIENTGAFYDAIFASLGARKSYDTASAKAWQTKEGTPIFSIITPYNGHAATAGNGVMIALKAAMIMLTSLTLMKSSTQTSPYPFGRAAIHFLKIKVFYIRAIMECHNPY